MMLDTSDVYILCIETSTKVCSVALCKDEKVLVMEESNDIKSHTSMITIHIQTCLDKAGIGVEAISAVAISKGPGSYTGLRIGASTAKGICFGQNIPLIGIASTAVLRYSISGHEDKNILSAIDARREEIYAQYWPAGKQSYLEKSMPIVLNEDNPLKDLLNDSEFVVAGNGASKVKGYYPDHCTVGPIETSAAYMCKLAFNAYKTHEFENLVTFSPNYIKNANIILSKKKLL